MPSAASPRRPCRTARCARCSAKRRPAWWTSASSLDGACGIREFGATYIPDSTSFHPGYLLIRRGNPHNGVVMVGGDANAVEPGALVVIENSTGGASARVLAAGDGSFGADIAGYANDSLTLYAEDALGNRSGAVTLAPVAPLTLSMQPIGNVVAPLGRITRFTVMGERVE